MSFEIKTAEELADPVLEARWQSRRDHPHMVVLRDILGRFAAQGGPIRVADLAATPSGRVAVAEAVAALDADDLIRVSHGLIDLAYPFSARPTPFVLRLSGGRERFAVCAIDALGIAPMLGEPVEIVSACHHCRTPLAFAVTPEGPSAGAEGTMVWVGERQAGGGRMVGSL
jgi:hypothetical protein